MDGAAEHVDEQQREHDRLDRREEHLLLGTHQRLEVPPRHGQGVLHGPAHPAAAWRGSLLVQLGEGDSGHAASFPSVVVCTLGLPATAAAVPAGRALVFVLCLRLVPGEAQEDVVEAGLAQRQAAHGDLGGVERPEDLGADGRSILHRQLDDGVLDDRFLRRQRREEAEGGGDDVAVAERHRDDRGAEVGLELGRRALGNDVPVVDHHDVAGETVRLLEVLGGEQHGRPLAHQLFDDAPEVLSALGVEAGGWLVQEEDWRARDQRGRQVEAATHAARVGLEHPVAGVGQAEGLQELVGPPGRGAAAQVGEPPDHVDVLVPGQVLVDRGVLAGQTDEAAYHVGLLRDVVPEHGATARVGLEDGGEDPHGRGLARPVRAEQAEHGPGLDAERDTVERAHVAPGKDLDQIVRLHGQ